MRRETKGQALIATLISIPLFTLLAGLSLREGKTILIHHRVTSHCHYIVLEVLRIEAEALEKLGKMNPCAKRLIDSRRAIDIALAASPLAPPVLAELLNARKTLITAQRFVGARQRHVIEDALFRANLFVHHASARASTKDMVWQFNPPLPAQNRSVSAFSALRRLEGYESETGAPLALNPIAQARARYGGSAIVRTENLLPAFRPIAPSTNMTISCEAQIEMKTLEGPWTVILSNAANHLSKPL